MSWSVGRPSAKSCRYRDDGEVSILPDQPDSRLHQPTRREMETCHSCVPLDRRLCLALMPSASKGSHWCGRRKAVPCPAEHRCISESFKAETCQASNFTCSFVRVANERQESSLLGFDLLSDGRWRGVRMGKRELEGLKGAVWRRIVSLSEIQKLRSDANASAYCDPMPSDGRSKQMPV